MTLSSDELRRALLYPGPPHHLISFYLLHLLALDPQQIVVDYLDTPLRELAYRWQQKSGACLHLTAGDVANFFATLEAKLDEPLDEIVRTKRERARVSTSLSQIAGDTTLRMYCEENVQKDLTDWCEVVQEEATEAPLVDKALAEAGEHGGNSASQKTEATHEWPPAFAALYDRYDKQVRGFLRRHAQRDEDIADLVADTKTIVWRKLLTYDPAIGSFRKFIRYWADLMCKRRYAKKQDPLMFDHNDIKDGGLLATRWRAPDHLDPVSQYIRTKCSNDTLRLIGDYQKGNRPSQELLRALVKVLNECFRDRHLYARERFAHVALSDETQRLITYVADLGESQVPEARAALKRRNRLLLQDTYPNEITAWQMGIAVVVSATTLRPKTNDIEEEDAADVIAQFSPSDIADFDDQLFMLAVYDDLLHKVYDGSNPPHQSIAFGFTGLLEWVPRDIVSERSTIPLGSLATELERDFREISHMSKERVQFRFHALHESLMKTFREVVTEPATVKTYPDLHKRKLGTTKFKQYYTPRPPKEAQPELNIAHWCYAVKRRVGIRLMRERSGPLFEAIARK